MVSISLLSYVGVVLLCAGVGAAIMWRALRFRAMGAREHLFWVGYGIVVLIAIATMAVDSDLGGKLLALALAGTFGFALGQAIDRARRRRAGSQ